jgi:hypothetical protein
LAQSRLALGGNVVSRKPWYDISYSAVAGAGIGGAVTGGLLSEVAEGGVCTALGKSVGEGIASGLAEGAGNVFQPAGQFSSATSPISSSSSISPDAPTLSQ